MDIPNSQTDERLDRIESELIAIKTLILDSHDKIEKVVDQVMPTLEELSRNPMIQMLLGGN